MSTITRVIDLPCVVVSTPVDKDALAPFPDVSAVEQNRTDRCVVLTLINL